MKKQKTIKNEAQIEGIGLHTGNISKVTFKSAGIDHGIKFIRDDIDGKPEINADYRGVLGAIRGTTIGNGAVRVHTVEHILAVCSGLEIDNLEIHITNNEPPVLDGSAKKIAEVLINAGLVEQDAERKYISIDREITYECDKTKITAVPSDKFIIDCTVVYNHPFLSTSSASVEVNPGTFLKDIAPARTFCFDYEIESLKKRGLAKGGDFSNAIVVGIDGIHNPDKKLRFEDEFVRHKILDFIGDLYLAGKPIKAHIKAERCGHNHNINFVKELIKKCTIEPSGKKKEGDKMQDVTDIKGQVIDINAIKKIIPHRYPFLMIDRVIITEPLMTALGYKCVSGNENYFQGHFPGRPIMPGVLIIEAMAQTSCVLFLSRPDLRDKLAYFMSIDGVKFRRPVVPGDVLELKVEVTRARDRGGRIKGRAFVGDKLVAEAEFMFAVVEKEG